MPLSKQDLKESIAQNDTDNVIQKIMSATKSLDDPKWYNDSVIFWNRWQGNEREKMHNTISDNDYNQQKNRINSSLLFFIDTLPSSLFILANKFTAIRLRCHEAVFVRDPDNFFYFISITNLSQSAIEVTHVWFEDLNKQIEVKNNSRRLPKRLKQNEVWVTWLNFRYIPEKFRNNAYDKFRVRLSTGEIFDSQKEDSVPSSGSVPGGRINSNDML